MNRTGRCTVAFVAAACATLAFVTLPVFAQVAPALEGADPFSALGNSGVTGSTGSGTIVDGDVGSSPTASISNFPPSSVVPPHTIHFTNDLIVQQARLDAIAAYNFLAAQGPGTILAAQLNGAVLTSGIYSFAGGAADLAALGTLTLNGPGVFVFEVDSALTANVGSIVIGSADPCSVYWRVGTSATLNGISFRGNVIADASITIGSGANVTGRALAGTGPTGAVTMAGSGGNTLGGCAAATITVNKDFLPDSLATVQVDLNCTSGTVANTPLGVSEAAPGIFTVNGPTAGVTCTATETVPVGYTADQSACVGVPLGGSCTIVNTLLGNTVTVNKDFLPDSFATVQVDLTCTSGTVANTPLDVSETTPGVFVVNGATAGVTCTATETVPIGYTADETNCLSVPLGGSCTITNTQLAVAAIPTLSSWAMILLAMFLGLAGFAVMRRRTT